MLYEKLYVNGSKRPIENRLVKIEETALSVIGVIRRERGVVKSYLYLPFYNSKLRPTTYRRLNSLNPPTSINRSYR